VNNLHQLLDPCLIFEIRHRVTFYVSSPSSATLLFCYALSVSRDRSMAQVHPVTYVRKVDSAELPSFSDGSSGVSPLPDPKPTQPRSQLWCSTRTRNIVLVVIVSCTIIAAAVSAGIVLSRRASSPTETSSTSTDHCLDSQRNRICGIVGCAPCAFQVSSRVNSPSSQMQTFQVRCASRSTLSNPLKQPSNPTCCRPQ
jgi:hypothetical protein